MTRRQRLFVPVVVFVVIVGTAVFVPIALLSRVLYGATWVTWRIVIAYTQLIDRLAREYGAVGD